MKRIIYLILLILIIVARHSIAEDGAPQIKTVHDRKPINIKIEIKDERNLVKGIDSLHAGRYEKSAHFFEEFLLSNLEIFDQLLGINALSFGGLSSELNKGVEYFKKRIEHDKNDYRCFYYAGILRIMSLSIDGEGSNFLNEFIKLNPSSLKAHFLLGIAYLIQGDEDNYLKEYAFLKNHNSGLAQRLINIYDNSQVIKEYLKDIKSKKTQQIK